MTTPNEEKQEQGCPVEGLLKMLSGKWKPQLFRLALDGPLRFNALLRQLNGVNKQSLAIALKEMEEQGILDKQVVQLKPLHIEYSLSDKGKALTTVFRQLETML